MGSAEDYPYDPKANVNRLRGLDKLRAVRDRKIAQQLYELFPIAEANEQNPRLQAKWRLEEEDKRREEENLDKSMTEKALAGVYGPECKDLARAHLERFGNDRLSLKALRLVLRKVEGRLPG